MQWLKIVTTACLCVVIDEYGKKKLRRIRETSMSPCPPFWVKFQPLGRLFCPSHPLAY